MKLYEQKVFQKNGFKVNAVYVVKYRDTLTHIYRVAKKFGVSADELNQINPELSHGLGPGQFVYFYTKQPRFKDQENLVLNTYELSRTPYTLIEVKPSSDFKKILDEKVGYAHGWEHVFLVNKVRLQEFKHSPSHQFKIYVAESSASMPIQTANSKASFDQFFAGHQSESTEAAPLPVVRVPASAQESHAHKLQTLLRHRNVPIFALAVALVIFVIWYSSKSKKAS